MVTCAIFHLQNVFVQMNRTLVIYQPIPTNLVSKLQRHSPSRDTILISLKIKYFRGRETFTISVQKNFFCFVYI